jgi:hypothetical protein
MPHDLFFDRGSVSLSGIFPSLTEHDECHWGFTSTIVGLSDDANILHEMVTKNVTLKLGRANLESLWSTLLNEWKRVVKNILTNIVFNNILETIHDENVTVGSDFDLVASAICKLAMRTATQDAMRHTG